MRAWTFGCYATSDLIWLEGFIWKSSYMLFIIDVCLGVLAPPEWVCREH
jgi:hypothetical protein